MLGQLRAWSKPLLRTLAGPLARAGVNPHAVTLSAIPLALAAAIAIDSRHFAVAFVCALSAAVADLIDGTVAELQGRTTPLGNYLETMVDKIVEVILLAGATRICPLAAALACGTSLLVSLAKARVGLVIITDNRDWPVLGDRADRLLLLLVGLFVSARGYAALEPVLWLMVGINIVGIYSRMKYARRLIAEAGKRGTLLPYLSRRTQ